MPRRVRTKATVYTMALNRDEFRALNHYDKGIEGTLASKLELWTKARPADPCFYEGPHGPCIEFALDQADNTTSQRDHIATLVEVHIEMCLGAMNLWEGKLARV